ncbi:MAG: serine/threonine protein kinase [Oscillospiraceae bacterium]
MSGTVTLAENTADGRKYVLKELPEECISIYRRISELPMQENLMQVHELFRRDGNTIAVCDYAEGKPLDELLESGKVFPIDEMCRITSQLCRAVEQLHRNGIIHRDINPKNIILDERLHLTLIDYGISRLFTGSREQDTTLYGTEGYAPPEQYGFRETRFTADIYAIGMVMKLLLNVCPNCPPAREVLLRSIASKCTRFVPNKRYKSAAAVRRAVSRSRGVIPAGIFAACAAVLAGIIAAVLLLQNTGVEAPQISEVKQLPITSAETSAPIATQTAVPVTETSAPTTTQTAVPVTETGAPTTTQTAVPVTETSAPTTAQTVTTSVTEATQPQELHTSDMDNPDKIAIETRLNDRSFYEDFFTYQFYDDPAVHGEWRYFTTIEFELFNSYLTADRIKTNYFVGGYVFSELMFGDNGESHCILSSGEPMPVSSCWTNGFLICDYYEGTAAQRLFEATIDGEEFLFVAVKTGDFARENKVLFYEVYTRTE